NLLASGDLARLATKAAIHGPGVRRLTYSDCPDAERSFRGQAWRHPGKTMEQIIANLLNDIERGRMSRRQLVQTLAAGLTAATAAPALAAAPTKLKALSVNHYVLAVPDYAKTRDFYADLLGMKVSED